MLFEEPEMKASLNILVLWIAVSIFCIDTSAFSAVSTRINPTKDFVYLGAFRVPYDDTSNGTSWDSGGGGMSYNANGDSLGPSDGHPGTLFGIGKMADGNVTEYAIPKPVISKNLVDLPKATTIQTFKDITGGLIGGSLTTYRMGDIQLIAKTGNMLSDKLLWVLYEFYTPEVTLPGFGWSNVQLSNPGANSMVYLSNDVASATSRYIFEIPSTWASSHTNGKNILVGRSRGQMSGSWGPAFHAIYPQQYASFVNGSAIDGLTLLRYDETHPFPSPGWSHDSDDWNDGAWLVLNNKSAVILAGSKGVRTDDNKLIYYGNPGPDGCGDKGWHAEPNYAAILFYDPDDLAAVASGTKKPYEVKHYALLNVEKYMYKAYGCRKTILGGVGYDKVNQLVYIEERMAGNGLSQFSTSPVVHVWKLTDSKTTVLDTAAPSKPSNIIVADISSTEKKISWLPSSDDSDSLYYIVYRNGYPIIMTSDTQFIDNKFTLLPDTSFTYTVEARDSLNNSSTAEPTPTINSISVQ